MVSSMPDMVRTDTAPSALMRSIDPLHQNFGRRGSCSQPHAGRAPSNHSAAHARRHCPPCRRRCPRRRCQFAAGGCCWSWWGCPPPPRTSTCGLSTLTASLPVLRGVADVLLFGLAHLGKRARTAAVISAASSTLSVVCVTTASFRSGLGCTRAYVGNVFHQVDAVIELAPWCPSTSGWPLVADHDELVALFGEL